MESACAAATPGTSDRLSRRFRVTGVVQGVGFRPYVWRLASELGLDGWVRNDPAGVEILAAGDTDHIQAFTRRLPAEIPPLAELRGLQWADGPVAQGLSGFAIEQSGEGRVATMIGQDTATCPACLAELLDSTDRRYRYAFINCTQCGPRYTLTRGLPYDRALTSMSAFPLCPACGSEYSDPADRRFHAEPTACGDCGPALWLQDGSGRRLPGDPIAGTLERILAGEILAVKGLGGFHLVCDARNGDAVRRLRERKGREEKPFAVMPANCASIAQWVAASETERTVLESPERPILLLRKRSGVDDVFAGVAPGLAWLGVMLPYTPIHWLIFHEAAGRPEGTDWMDTPQDLVLVMTSANPGGEPLVIDNAEAEWRLADIADAMLLHDRAILVRCDDSVARMESHPGPIEQPWCRHAPQFIRRARGYTPKSIRLPASGPSALALGGWLKNTICITRGDEAFLSQHIGGLNNPATCEMLVEVTEHLLRILDVRPEALAHDLHPDLFSTRHAQALADALGVPAIGVQHHHAHCAAVAAEHGLTEAFLGLALDGVGLGNDGAAWGGELLRLEGVQFERLGHLTTLPLPGGDRAAREPWRMAAAVLHRLGRRDEIAHRFADQTLAGRLAGLLDRGLHCPPTSSLGRWFDAAAGLLGVRPVMAYEGQAAMLLEGLAEGHGPVAPLAGGWRIQGGLLDLLPLMENLADEPDAALGAARFHTTLAEALAHWVRVAAEVQGLNLVVLAGGCMLNHVLTRALVRRLDGLGIAVRTARQAPPNDGGISLGQAWVAMQSLNAGG